MTYLLLIFFISFLSITVMFGRKLSLVKNGKIKEASTLSPETYYTEKIKHLTLKKIKQYGYAGLVIIMRLYFRSKNLLKSKYEELKNRIKKIGENKTEVREEDASKFLKVVSDYKQKIRNLKHQIKEEENRPE